MGHREVLGKLLHDGEVLTCESEIAKPTPTLPLPPQSCHKRNENQLLQEALRCARL